MSPPAPTRVFVGSGEGRIHVFALAQPAEGPPELTPLGDFEAGENPSFLALHPRAPILYSVDERSPGRARAFTLGEGLVPLSETTSGGDGPAHLCVDREGRVLLLSNYGSGTVTAAHLHEDGSIAEPVSPPLKAGEKAHQIRVDATNRWVFVPCLGSDHIARYALDPAGARLLPTPTAPPIETEPGSGPRHLDLHPSNRFFFVVHELANTLTGYAFEASSGECRKLQTVPMLPGDFSGQSDGGGILVHPDGKLLFATNRGHDSVVTFTIDPAAGTLALVGHTPCGGRHPRHFTLTPDGAHLLVANMHSGDVQAFRVLTDAAPALLPLGEVARVPTPAFVGAWQPQHP